jgi:aspartyl/asparaginyl beta-hydroxylase (cupin superfamily)
MYIKWYGPSLSDAREKLPFTTELIDSIPNIKSAMLSVLEPGSVITPHTGPANFVLRYHLGLVIPEDRDNCWIKLDNGKYSWKEGEDVLFDDTFTHEVRNDTNELRIILFCDVKRDYSNYMYNTISNVACKIARVTTRNNK